MRRQQSLQFTHLTVPGTAAAVAPEGLRLDLEFARDGDWLTVVFRLTGRERADLPAATEWWARDHAVICLDPGHDHFREIMVIVERTGAVRTSHRLVMPGEERNDRIGHDLADPVPEHTVTVHDDGAAWGGTVCIDIGWRTGPVIGLAAKGVSGGTPLACAVFPAPAGAWWDDTPLGYADLYLEPRAARVTGIDLGAPEWGLNTARVTLAPGGPPAAAAAVFRFGDGEMIRRTTGFGPEGGELPYELDFRAKWSSDLRGTARLEVTLESGGRTAWRGAFPVGFDGGIIARDRLGGAPVERPGPDHPAFPAAMREYLLARLPAWERVSEPGGPAGVFGLRAGDQAIDLGAAGVFDTLAAVIRERFDRWDDGLCAASVFLGAAAGVRHSAACAAFGAALAPRGLLQLGAGFCGDMAALYGALALALAPRYGLTLAPCAIGLRGHIAAAVAVAGGMHVFDPMLGLFFHALDNTRLATLDELRAEKEISHRMDATCGAHGHEFYYGIPHHVITPLRSGGRLLV
ncbi:MAG: hypothetical protein ABIF71_09355 [Planctomycetota bacterium]